MMKSSLLLAVPREVVTVIGPEVAKGGTMADMAVVVAAVTSAEVPLKATRLPKTVFSNLSPAIVTTVPAVPAAGVKPVITGGTFTVKGSLLVAVPLAGGAVIRPRGAPGGPRAPKLGIFGGKKTTLARHSLNSFWP